MSKKRDRTVYRRSDGRWANKRNDASRASSIHSTQKEAEAAARGMLQNQGGGELTTQGRNGQILSKDTIALGHDTFPPKDKPLATKARRKTKGSGGKKTKSTGPRKK